jgi:oxygen-dependent protoporphyrinogen oxidase
MTRIIVVGGGIAGLAAAYYASRVPNVQVALLESSSRWGGKITTDRVEIDEGQFIIEGGRIRSLPQSPGALRCVRSLVSVTVCMGRIHIRKILMS